MRHNAGSYVIYDATQTKQENQRKAIRSFTVYHVDVIAFVPIVEASDNVLREAQIPVFLVDRTITTADETLYKGYVSFIFKNTGLTPREFRENR